MCENEETMWIWNTLLSVVLRWSDCAGLDQRRLLRIVLWDGEQLDFILWKYMHKERRQENPVSLAWMPANTITNHLIATARNQVNVNLTPE